MPRRVATRRVVGGPQGEDAWVELRHQTVRDIRESVGFGPVSGLFLRAAKMEAEAKQIEPLDPVRAAECNLEARQLIDQAADARFAADNETLTRRLVAWNWCDETGAPLPQPADDPTALDNLTEGERRFLLDALRTLGQADSEARLKNSGAA